LLAIWWRRFDVLPLRLELEGFLTYRDPVALDFRDDWLWAITGKNGTGKSSLFDAITFALYGQHRGGAQGAERLISQGSSYMRVAFDFELAGEDYRVERTLIRRQGPRETVGPTYQAYVLHSEGDQLEAFPIADASTRDGLLSWVQETLGFGYRTFASSVLLGQGKADRFILARPGERKMILMDLLDLSDYVELETTTKRRRDRAELELGALDRQLAPLRPATDEAAQAAEGRRDIAHVALQAAERELERALHLERQAKTAAQLVEDLTKARAQLSIAQALLSQAETIEHDAQEAAGLDRTVPALARIHEHRQAAVDKREQARKLREQAAQIDLAAIENLSRARSLDVDEADKGLHEARSTMNMTREALDRLVPIAEAGRRLVELEQELTDMQTSLDEVRGELEGGDAARARLAQSEEAARALDPLRTLREHYAIANEAENARASAATRLEGQQTDLRRLEEQAHLADERETSAAEASRKARDAWVDAQARVTAVKLELQARRGAATEGTCSRCGQPVSSAHIAKEIRDAQARLAATQSEERKLSDAAEAATRDVAQQQSGAAAVREEARTAADAIRQTEEYVRQQATRREEALTRCMRAVAQLPEAYRARVEEDSSYPSEGDLQSVQSESHALAQLRDEARRFDQLEERVRGLDGRVREVQTRIGELRQRFRGEDLAEAQSLHDEMRTLAQKRQADEKKAEQVLARAKSEAAKAVRILQEAQESSRSLCESASTNDQHAAESEAAAGALVGQVEEPWRARAGLDLLALALELEVLRRRFSELAGAEERLRELHRARESSLELAGRAQYAEEQLERIPADERLPLEKAIDRLEAARQDKAKRQLEHDVAARAGAELAEQVMQRRNLETQCATVMETYNDYAWLTRLFGKDHLQAWLVQEAQSVIGDAANQFLTGISEGMLRIDMVPEGDDLEILVSDFSSAGEPIEVRFISGSQQFRVAVAIALAIGQYSGSSSRNIRSVIIDEGFGSLDEDGRREMIAQLKSLENVLDRVIVVSHQEEFDEAFSNGYHIEKVGRTSIPRRRRDGELVHDLRLRPITSAISSLA
jgi:DNA repair exonuclease SbcCD ATPase subunit